MFIKGYEGYYSVTKKGEIISNERIITHKCGKKKLIRERVLKPSDNGNGYVSVSLRKKGMGSRMYIHRIVAKAFLEKPKDPSKKCVNHKDGNKSNNNVENLEWVTYSENELHSYRVLGKDTMGKKGGGRKLSYDNVKYILDNTECITVRQMSIYLNVSTTTVISVIKGKSYKDIIKTVTELRIKKEELI